MTDEPAASTAATPTAPAEARANRDRPADLVLAGVHLRLGSLALARAELETMAGRDALDDEGILDLAEARWRTGDVEGAGEAAALVLDEEDGPLVALIVAAEAAAARGRPTEARRLAAKALAVANGSIDRIFAGMPRSQAWPPDPAAPPPAPTTMFDPPHGASADRSRQARRPGPIRGTRPVPTSPGSGSPVQPSESTEPAPATSPDAVGTIGLWGEDGDADAEHGSALPGATEALEEGRLALDSDRLSEASVHLALVLRLSTALAPAVLDLVADRQEPELAFVRGDAYRLVGREIDAQRAYARATAHAVSTAHAAPTASPASSGLEPAPDRPDDTDPKDDRSYEGDRA